VQSSAGAPVEHWILQTRGIVSVQECRLYIAPDAPSLLDVSGRDDDSASTVAKELP